jgi:branched-chain amino acid transport system substrate-binding protein
MRSLRFMYGCKGAIAIQIILTEGKINMKGKKLLSVLLAAAMIFTLLSACGSSNSKSSANSTSGSSDSGSTASGGTVKVGVLLPLSGATAYYGGVQLNGIEFCVDYINKNGGLKSMNGAQIELVVQDSASDPETGVSAFEKLVEEGVVAVIGPYNSTVAAATAPLAIQYQVPYIIVNSTAENFLTTQNKYVYRTNTGSSDGDNMWNLIIQYLNKVRPNNPTDKIAIVYDSGDWGTAAVNTWRENASKMGYQVVVDEAVSESTTDMSTLVNKIKSADADLVITACFSAATNLLVKQMSEYGCTAKIAGLGGGVGDKEFIENCGNAANGVLYSAPWIPSYGGAGEDASKLAEKFKTTYGYDMTMEPCWGWLGMATIVNGIEKAGKADRDAIADALSGLDVDKTDWSLWFSGYDGVHFATNGQQNSVFGDSGIRYNNNDKLGETDGMVLVQVQDGKWTIVYPTTYNNGADNINY